MPSGEDLDQAFAEEQRKLDDVVPFIDDEEGGETTPATGPRPPRGWSLVQPTTGLEGWSAGEPPIPATRC